MPFCRRGCLPAAGEIRGEKGFLEFRTAVERDGKRGAGGRLSVGSFSNVPFEVIEKTTAFQGELLEIAFTRRNDYGAEEILRLPLSLGAHGVSVGKAPPAVPEEEIHRYPKEPFTVENVAAIPCRRVLGSDQVTFER